MKKNKKVISGYVLSILLFGIIAPLFSSHVLVMAQTGTIDVYVYDWITYDPIEGADVELYDGTHLILDIGLTDISGFYQFTSLDIGDYWVEVHAEGYQWNETEITIDFEGEGELVEFYQETIFTPGNGYIDVYVYDVSTMNPLVGADVSLYTEEWNYVTSGVTDGTGFYNFTGLGAATYLIEGDIANFDTDYSSVTIDFDGEGEYQNLYLAPSFVPGDGFIDVYVYDNNTLNPIDEAVAQLYTEYYGWVNMGLTDITGFFNFSGLGAGNYIVEALADGYVLNSSTVTIDFDGEGEYLVLYLPPFEHTIDILSPSDSDTIEGGLVLVSCDANDVFNLDDIEVYVNTILITTFDVSGGGGFISEFFVPVFGNGTNTIELVANWLDMSTDSDSVEVNSINVIPVVDLKEGDIMNYRYDILTSTQVFEYNFTFTNWLSPFEMNIEVILHMSDHTGTIQYVEYDMVVNVLNGYVSVDPTSQFLSSHFFPFSSLLPNPQIGDKTAMVMWYEILIVNGSDSWKYTDIWTLEYMGTPAVVYVEQSSNIVYFFNIPGQMEAILLETTIDFLNPSVSDVADFEYTVGETGNIISWDATDMNPGTYIINEDGVEVDTGIWNSTTPIVINVDDLSAGTYVYRIVVMDLAGNIAEDTVTVTVNPIIPELSLFSNLLLIPTFVFVAYVIMRKREK